MMPSELPISSDDVRKLHTLLRACPVMRSNEALSSILQMLPAHITDTISKADRLDVYTVNIVSACLCQSGGIQELVKAIEFFDGTTIQFASLNEFVNKLPAYIRQTPIRDEDTGSGELINHPIKAEPRTYENVHHGVWPSPVNTNMVRVSISRLPLSGQHFVGRDDELKQLDAAWDDRGIHIISIVAWGGVGKSALVNHWVGSIEQESFRGATQVFAWSFYDQGADGRTASADQFIDTALREFGDPSPSAGSPREKGERLALLVRKQRALLILDGLEPLQFPPGRNAGQLKDPAVATLLRELAAQNPGLCVITTRETVADLASRQNTTAPCLQLRQLSLAASAELLQHLGVRGHSDLLRFIARKLGGHALALTLLGTYLRDVWGGDAAQWDKVELLEQDDEAGGNAQCMLASYEEWFKANGQQVEIEILRLMGLFNQPADLQALKALCRRPAIPVITEALQDIDQVQWRRATARLRRAGLLAEPDLLNDEKLDTHPLVREYFARKLYNNHHNAWREGHNRLYEHLKHSSEEFPSTLEEVMPLYDAILHGCAAGHHEDALFQVYWRRIQRKSQFFSSKVLGTVGADVAALASFFDDLWDKPVKGISNRGRSLLLYEAGETLHALGRLEEASNAMRALFDGGVRNANLKDAVRGAITLSELSLTMGDIATSIRYATEAVKYADRELGKFHRQVSRSTLARALHQSGRYDQAEHYFIHAESIEQERRPDEPLLSSMQGYAYADFLLAKGAYHDVAARASRTIEWAKRERSLLAIALDYLTLGRAHFHIAYADGSPDISQAASELDHAIDGLRQAGVESHLPPALLARAELWRFSGDFERARLNLADALEIAMRGGMKLHEADCHLEFTRMYLMEGNLVEAQQSFSVARSMVARLSYGNRDRDVAELEALCDIKSPDNGNT